jgi:hypothetical protein
MTPTWSTVTTIKMVASIEKFVKSFPNLHILAIQGPPNYKTITGITRLLNADAASIHSELRGRKHRHLLPLTFQLRPYSLLWYLTISGVGKLAFLKLGGSKLAATLKLLHDCHLPIQHCCLLWRMGCWGQSCWHFQQIHGNNILATRIWVGFDFSKTKGHEPYIWKGIYMHSLCNYMHIKCALSTP